MAEKYNSSNTGSDIDKAVTEIITRTEEIGVMSDGSVDVTDNGVKILTMASNITLVDNLSVGQTATILVKNGNIHTLTYPASVDFGDAGTPTLDAQTLLGFTKLEDGVLIAFVAWSKSA